MNQHADIQALPPSGEIEQQWLNVLWQSEWGGDIMVSRGHAYRLAELQSLVAKVDGQLVGAATYRLNDADCCELMSINANNPGGGIGSKLLTAVEEAARTAGCHRVWLITSNDNMDALRFYQRRCILVQSTKRDEANLLSHLSVTMVSRSTTRLSWQRISREMPDMTELETDRLLLRPYTMDDLDVFSALWADPQVVRFIGEGVTRNRNEAEERLQQIIVSYESGYGLLAAWHNIEKRVVGHAGLVQQIVDGVDEIELGYWLARDFWGQGLATEAALMLRDYAMNALGLGRLISLIQPGNVASIAVAKRLGMRLERNAYFKGKLVCIYSTQG